MILIIQISKLLINQNRKFPKRAMFHLKCPAHMFPNLYIVLNFLNLIKNYLRHLIFISSPRKGTAKTGKN